MEVARVRLWVPAGVSFLRRRKNISPWSAPLARPVMIKLPATQETSESCILARLRYFSWVCDDVQAFASFFFSEYISGAPRADGVKGKVWNFCVNVICWITEFCFIPMYRITEFRRDKTCTFQGWDFAEFYRNGVVKDVNGGEVIKSGSFRMDKSIDFKERVLNGTQ